MWRWLKENHPIAYEVIQWGVLMGVLLGVTLVAVAAIFHECI